MSRLRELLVISDEEINKIRQHYGKTAEDVQRDIGILKEWLRQERHLPDDEDDWFLENMLISTKFRVEIAKEKLENLYTVKSVFPTLTKYYDIDNVYYQQAIDTYVLAVLPNLTKNLERCVFTKITNCQKFNLDMCYSVSIILELARNKDYSLSFLHVMDWSDVTIDLVKTFDLSFLKTIFHVVINSFSVRLSKVICINAPTYIDILFKLLKFVLKPKIYEKFLILHSIEEVYEFIPKDMMPKDYGGKGRSIFEINQEIIEEINRHKDFFKKLALRKSNEKLRIKPLESNEFYGINGTFKKLNID